MCHEKVVVGILPAGRPFNPNTQDGATGYTMHGLIDTYHYLKAHPDVTVWVGRWPAQPMRWPEWRAWFRECLNAKINRDEKPRGKKDCAQYEEDLQHDVALIRQHYGSRVRWCGRNLLKTPEAKRRYPHIDNYGMEE